MSEVAEYGTEEERLRMLEDINLDMTAIERYMKSNEMRVPQKDDNFELKVAQQLNSREFLELINQYKYAGRQTLNYFIVKNIDDFGFDEIIEEVEKRLPNESDVEDQPREPYLAGYEIINDRLYFAIGYKELAGGEDPETGKPTSQIIPKRVVVIIHDEKELVEVRGSDERMVDKVLNEICKSIGKYKDSMKTRPNLGKDFQEKFNELVEKYFNLKVKVDDQENSTLDTISFTSKQDESGQRKDARKSKRVERELSEEGSEITMGYVEINEGFRFRLNRDRSKLSFMKAEMEEHLNKITEIIDNVLRETGEYSQEKLSGLDDVPE